VLLLIFMWSPSVGDKTYITCPWILVFGTMVSGERVSWVNVVVASTRYEIFDVDGMPRCCLCAVELQDPRTNIMGTCPEYK
jgi:hypothetical protein